MRHLIFSIHDVKAGAYLPPFILPTEAMAVRSFSDACNDVLHAFGQHPEDYTLFCLGDFQDSKGLICLEGGNRSIGNGVEFVGVKVVDQMDLLEAIS